MASVEAVQGVSPQGRELRPELDLAVLQSYELVRFYTIQELKMIEPISVREEGLQPVASVDPAPLPIAALPWVPLAAEPAVDTPTHRDADDTTSPEISRAHRGVPPSPNTQDAEASCVTEAAGEPASEACKADAPETLPYGADIARIRQLVEHIVTGREVVPFTFHYRQAGDLVELQSPAARPVVSARQVAAVYKAY